MPISGINEVQFQDGEGADYADLTNISRYIKATMLDQVMAPRARTALTNSTPPTTVLFSPGGGYPTASATINVITNVAGTLMQWASAGESTGLDAKLLVYRVSAGELLTTLAVGDATNPRWDGIFIKLAYADASAVQRDFQDAGTLAKTSTYMSVVRNVSLAKSVVMGTPGATPTMPTAPAGYVPWAYVYVPAAHNGVFTSTQLSDARMPTQLGSTLIQAPSLVYDRQITGGHGSWQEQGSGAGSWVENSAAHGDGSSKLLYAMPGLSADHRILGVEILGVGGGTHQTAVVRKGLSVFPQTDTDPTPNNSYVLENSVSAGYSLTGCVGGSTRPAIWGNGYAAGLASLDFSNTTFALRIQEDASSILKIAAIRVIYAY